MTALPLSTPHAATPHALEARLRSADIQPTRQRMAIAQVLLHAPVHLAADDILAVPDDFYTELGLAKLISPLRLRGMSAMLTRIKRRLRDA